MRFAKLEGCALLEEADEFEQVAAIMGTLEKNMKVVGHQTVGMKTVGMAGGTFEQQRKDTMRGRFVAEIVCAVVTANGDEIGLTAEVVFRGETGHIAMDGHTEKEYTERDIEKEKL
jgi:hypothetical protein